MSLRFPIAAAAAFVGMATLAAPAVALQTIHIPDPLAQAQSDGPPDALFDKSIPDSWEKKTTDSSSKSNLGSFHFTVSGSGGSSLQSPSASGDAKVPGSEFYQPLPGYQDPYLPH